MEKKKIVRGKQITVDLEDIFNGTSPEEAIDNIVRICNDIDGEQHKFSIEYNCHDDHYDLINLSSYRFETDKEYERRMEAEKHAKLKKAELKKKQEESEKKEYERLKNKYDNK
jgi:hypothetical protein